MTTKEAAALVDHLRDGTADGGCALSAPGCRAILDALATAAGALDAVAAEHYFAWTGERLVDLRETLRNPLLAAARER